MASAFTAVRLQPSFDGPADLAWARVAVVTGTSGEELLHSQGRQVRAYPFVIQACKALQRGEVEAVVYNKAILSYMIKDYGWKELSVLPHTLVVEDYAMILPSGSPLRESINRAVLHIIYFDCLSHWVRIVVYINSMEPIACAVSNDRNEPAHCVASAADTPSASARASRTETPRTSSGQCPGESAVG